MKRCLRNAENIIKAKETCWQKKTDGRNITGLVYPCDNFKVENNAVIKTSADESHTAGVAVFRN